MRRGLAGDRKSFGLGFADGVEGDRGADVLEVHVHAGFAGHVNVAFDDFEFRVLRNAWNAKLAGHRTVIDRAGVVVFAMLDEYSPDSLTFSNTCSRMLGVTAEPSSLMAVTGCASW